MNSIIKKIAFIFFIHLFFNFIFANEIDLEKNNELFVKMFGEEYEKVIASKGKQDDEKFGLDLITNAAALSSKPELQIYIKLKAAELLADSDKNKKQARDLLIEINPSLPQALKKDIAQKVFELQRKILNATPKANKALYAEEVELFVSSAQVLSAYLLKDSDFLTSLTVLREGLNHVMTIDKDAGNELNKKIQAIQKESNRYSQVLGLIEQVKNNAKDEKANQQLSEYYLFERNNFFMAWPYLENTKNEAFKAFFNSLKLCLTDENKLTPNGLSLQISPLITAHPKYFLNWLGNADIVDENGELKKQLELATANKKIQPEKIEAILTNTVNAKGSKQEVSYLIYLTLASDISAIIDMVVSAKKLDSEASKSIIAQLISNKFISLSKANIKLESIKPINEVDKLKIELELGKVKIKMKELEIDEFKVEFSTPFLLQQKDSLLDKIDVSGGGIYTFDANGWVQFNKDFDILVDNKPFDLADKKSLFVQNGVLVFNEKKSYRFTSKKKKWTSNMEVSFDVMKDYEPTKQAIDFYLLFDSDLKWNKSFGVMYAFFGVGGWFGVINNEGWESFTASKLCKYINSGHSDITIWKSEKVKMTTIVKDNKLEIYINDEQTASFAVGDISKEKGFPNMPLQLYFSKRFGNEGPVKIDNLYIGPPRPIKNK